MSDDLSTLLRERVSDARPDLDRLVRVATTQGTRIRRIRRAGVALGSAAVVAAVAVAATQLVGGQLRGGSPTQGSPVFASQPAPGLRPPVVGQRLRLGGANGAGKIFKCRGGVRHCTIRGVPAIVLRPNQRGVGSGFVVAVQAWPGTRAEQLKILARLDRRFPGIAMAMPADPGTVFGDGRSTSSSNLYYRGQDVTIHLAGWKQIGPIDDDKQTIQGPHGAVASIAWRDAAEHDAWAASPDKGSNPGVWTSAVHGDVFVSIQGGAGTHPADIQALGASLTWN